MSLRLKMTLLVAVLLSVSMGVLSVMIYRGEQNRLNESIQMEVQKVVEWVVENFVVASDKSESDGEQTYSIQIPKDFISAGITTENLFMLFETVNILDANGEPLYNLTQPTEKFSGILFPLTLQEDENTGFQTLNLGGDGGYPIRILTRKISLKGKILGYVQIIKPVQSMLDYQSSLKTNLIQFSAISVAFCTMVVWVVLGFMLRRVRQATGVADEIRLKQDFSRRVPYRGANDEIGKLSRSLNQMLETIQNSYDRLKNSLVQQRQFVADVSHELRTPLTTIKGNLSLLRSGKIRDEEDKEEILADISEETDRLVKLVGEMLDLARADIADGKLDMEIFPLRELTEACRRQMAVLDADRELTVLVPDDLMVKSDRAKLKQLLIILLDNAYKHSDGQVALSAALDKAADRVEIRVRDNGEGIPSELIPTIFDRFRRGKSSGSGLGLGLSIAKALTTALHGDIRVESEPGSGACFIVALSVNPEDESLKS